jgi:glutamate-5-semialdehyde dehydrogenase
MDFLIFIHKKKDRKSRIMEAQKKNAILKEMIRLLSQNQTGLIKANEEDVNDYSGEDKAMYDRLIIDEKKVAGMIRSVEEVLEKEDPVGRELYRYTHPKGMTVINRTAAFGTIMIIYESRPDVTIEAAALAFKAGNRILLKGGKEAHRSNRFLVDCWHKALASQQESTRLIQYLDYPREKTQAFLKSPSIPIDLIVPRGGERLISFVKQHAQCPVLVSGRGNNFLYVHSDADWQMAQAIIMNAKTQKISACNALDKVLIDQSTPQIEKKVNELIDQLQSQGVEVWGGSEAQLFNKRGLPIAKGESPWLEEFLGLKILIDFSDTLENAVKRINQFSGGHSATILTEDESIAAYFMENIDAAAVYHNASTRFTDGGQFGMGGELAISTDKLHHRGPLGLNQLVSNKWYIYGQGQVR